MILTLQRPSAGSQRCTTSLIQTRGTVGDKDNPQFQRVGWERKHLNSSSFIAMFVHPLLLSATCERALADSDLQFSLEMLKRNSETTAEPDWDFPVHSTEDTLARMTQGCQWTPGIRHPETPGASTHRAAQVWDLMCSFGGSARRSLRWHLPLPLPNFWGRFCSSQDDGVAIDLSELGHFQ